jgi:nucleotide-binding universal stress UspA family protein
MPKIQTILCPVDFSEFSVNAYEYAESLAFHYKAKLLLQHVLFSMKPIDWWSIYPESYEADCQKLRADAERKLRQFAKQHARTEIQPQFVVQDGSVTDLVLSLAEAEAVNLIVMGTHGLRGVDRLMLGSVTEKVLRRARCPVLAVRRPAHHVKHLAHDPDPVHLRKILLCTDFSDHARHASEYALSMAKEYGAELTVLHVLEHFSSSTDLQNATAEALKQLEQVVAAHQHNSYTVNHVVRVGKPYQQIIQFAVETQSDLAIMGVRGSGALDTCVFGSTTYRVVQLGPCPVLAIHIQK